MQNSLKNDLCLSVLSNRCVKDHKRASYEHIFPKCRKSMDEIMDSGNTGSLYAPQMIISVVLPIILAYFSPKSAIWATNSFITNDRVLSKLLIKQSCKHEIHTISEKERVNHLYLKSSQKYQLQCKIRWKMICVCQYYQIVVLRTIKGHNMSIYSRSSSVSWLSQCTLLLMKYSSFL